MARTLVGLGIAVGVAGCGDDGRRMQDATGATMPGTTSGSATTGSASAEVTSSTSPPPASTSGSSSSGDGTDGGPKLDLGPLPDVPGLDGCENVIPATCDEAAMCPTTVGCEFFGVDLDQLDGGDLNQFAISVSNVQTSQDADVTLERKVAGVWEVVEGPVTVAALDLYTFLVDDFHQEESGKLVGGAYRVTSDVPIVAYQFNPLNLDGMTASSDATMLFPVTAWDHVNHVVGWEPLPQSGHGAYLTVAAGFDGTTVEITPSTAVLAGVDVPAAAAGETFEVELDAGDIVEVMTKTGGVTLSGSRVVTDENHPVAVFSGAECTFVLAYSCDHLENQMSGVRLWGLDFIAARVPPRTSPPETSVWQVYASEDATTVTFDASASVTGVPAAPVVLDAGELLVLEVGGVSADPGDFAVSADRPITLMNYMTGSSLAGSIGDPAMVQVPPVEQFLPRYVVLVPVSWDTDIAVVTRPEGAPVLLDGAAIPDADFIPVGTGWEVARVPVADGVHTFEGDEAFGVIIVGTTAVDSYAYVGGIGTSIINPTPEG